MQNIQEMPSNQEAKDRNCNNIKKQETGKAFEQAMYRRHSQKRQQAHDNCTETTGNEITQKQNAYHFTPAKAVRASCHLAPPRVCA